MSFAENTLNRNRPENISDVSLPRRQPYYPSPGDWRDEILYFLLVDRFSDTREDTRPLLDRQKVASARPALPNGESWRWDRWSKSGGDRWQGGTIKGVKSKIGYLKKLGVSTLWLSPLFKQRGHLDTYHGYGIQDFLDVDPRFGNRNDIVELVSTAHAEGMRIILDIIFNHSGSNWLYPSGTPGGIDEPYYTNGRYRFGSWLGLAGQEVDLANDSEEGVWPRELQNKDSYTRAGNGNLGAGDINNPFAEHKRSDFLSLRDFRLGEGGLLNELARCYKYWIALTDCDGFRIDTLKHVSLEEARNFCGSIKEFAASIGKKDFFIVGEIAGGDYNQDRYLDVLQRNMNAALDIGAMRIHLHEVAKGLADSSLYFNGFDPGKAVMGSHRTLGEHHVSILDDHDHVFGEKIRFSSEASSDHQVVAGVALQLFSLGIPCIYYGTEQTLGGPELSERKWLSGWKSNDRYLREAMFGPLHPLKAGLEGLPTAGDSLDENLPGFGPFGTAGYHCFDEDNPAYIRIAQLAKTRQAYPVLRLGRQYPRPVSVTNYSFGFYGAGQIFAWSRILDDEEAVCVINSHGTETRSADVLVGSELNPSDSYLTVILNTAETADKDGYTGTHPVGERLPVNRTADGKAYIEIRNMGASEVLVLSNYP